MGALLILLFIWSLPCLIAAGIASSKGRSGGSYFAVSFFFTPVIGIIAALLASPDPAHTANETLYTGEGKKCPYCAEIIKQEAKVCRYCGRELPAGSNPKRTNAPRPTVWDALADIPEPPKPKVDERAIYLFYGEQQVGPFTITEVIKMWMSNEIPESALYWREGFSDWQPVSTLVK